MKKIFLAVFLLFIYLSSCTKAKGPIVVKIAGCDSTVHYSATIVPILNTNCTLSHCHNAGSVNGDFTTYVGVSAKVTNGSLLNRVVVLKTMPASGPLSDADISRINCWIQQGAPNN
ncbi:MAG: hypothetical protein ACXVPU_09220 [Bacteroidia bacterium]